jgi:hypothetical protein
MVSQTPGATTDPGPGQFGPNTAQVERFLALVEQLSDGEWSAVEAVGRATTTVRPSPVGAIADVDHGWARRAGDLALDLAPKHGDVDLLAQQAAEALVVRDALSDRFDEFYAPFATVIPLTCLVTTDCAHQQHQGLVAPVRVGHHSDGSE